MRLMSFALGGEARFGAVDGDEVVDVTARLGARFPSLLAVLEAGALDEVRAALSRPGPHHALAAVEWLEPIPHARRIF